MAIITRESTTRPLPANPPEMAMGLTMAVAPTTLRILNTLLLTRLPGAIILFPLNALTRLTIISGTDEFDACAKMADAHDNLWLDTTMVLAGYLPMDVSPDLAAMRTDRILYGMDFPDIPYARERKISS